MMHKEFVWLMLIVILEKILIKEIRELWKFSVQGAFSTEPRSYRFEATSAFNKSRFNEDV